MAALFKRSTSLLSSFSRLSIASATPCASPLASTSSSSLFQPQTVLQVRHKSLVPRRTKYRKAHKGRIPIATGGSTKGTTLEWGDYGLRVNEPVRLSAKHLETAEAALKRGLKPVRGSKVYLRVFPDIPVCIKGNETRMGKGKGSFEFWSCRARAGRVILEIGGPNLRPEIAHAVMKLAAAKLPVTTEVIDKTTPPRVGFEAVEQLEEGPRIVTRGEIEAAIAKQAVAEASL
ncbi:ribosomal protein L10e/L16 [Leucosporidium creatinivorum]|uniref:Ribosomal protein L10e/L16 n=1 Tax=Leucosporidium creatinivorum TaxID=106004 RepID=A0A1Y2FTT8_9BASI|nr:ribosomal protein L10e/L16 [Leucosporidium creatinivorum]